MRRAVVPVGLAATALLAILNLPTYAALEGPTAERAATGTTMALVDQLSLVPQREPVLFDSQRVALRRALQRAGARRAGPPGRRRRAWRMT